MKIKVDKNLFSRLADLAKLENDDSFKYTKNFESVIAFIEKLGQIDTSTSSVIPTGSGTLHFDQDLVMHDVSKDDILGKSGKMGMFWVPKVIE